MIEEAKMIEDRKHIVQSLKPNYYQSKPFSIQTKTRDFSKGKHKFSTSKASMDNIE